MTSDRHTDRQKFQNPGTAHTIVWGHPKIAMEALKTQKSNLKEKVSTLSEKETELKIGQEKIKSNLPQCKNNMSNLETVNTDCKAKIDELNICKN